MNKIAKLEKVIIFKNKDSEDYWLEEPFREEYYQSELEVRDYEQKELLKEKFNDNTLIDEFVYNYLKSNGETPGDFTLFIKELRAFLKMHKEKQTEDNRIG
jgi:hypothetical protein